MTTTLRVRRAALATAAILAIPTLSFGPTALSAMAVDATCTSLTSPVYQLIKTSPQTSLLTPWTSEVTSAATYGFTTTTKPLVKGSLKAATGLVPVKRLYNGSTYDFTWSANDADTTALTAKGYSLVKTEFYASPTALSCSTPIHRLVKGPAHRNATSDEAPALVAAGWTDEGVQFHAPSDRVTTAPTTTATSPTTTTTSPTTTTTTTSPTTTTTTTSPTTPGLSPADADGKFSLAIYPDTQMEVMSSTDRRLSNRNAYVVSQKTARDIRYVLHVGDLVCWDTASATNPNDHRQYDNASREMKNLEAGGIPWAPAIGNHDTYAVGPTGGSARPGVVTADALRDTKTYNSYFPVSRFNISGTFEAGKVDNAYRLFDAGGKKWMILNLELWPRSSVVTWAKSVVAANPTRNVIVVTHSYLTGDSGSIESSNGGYGAMSPKYVYDNLIKVYPNVKFVFSGHVNTSAIRTDTGVNGNKIISILTSFHSTTTNQVRFLEIDTINGAFSTDIYAPWTSALLPAYDSSVTGMTWVG